MENRNNPSKCCTACRCVLCRLLSLRMANDVAKRGRTIARYVQRLEFWRLRGTRLYPDVGDVIGAFATFLPVCSCSVQADPHE